MASFWMMTNNEDKRNCITQLLYLVRGGFASAANAHAKQCIQGFCPASRYGILAFSTGRRGSFLLHAAPTPSRV